MIHSNVYIYKLKDIYYPKKPPFHPHFNYPEYPFREISRESNPVYNSFRDLLRLMGFNNKFWGTNQWNPFKDIINPGNSVLIKPNLVLNDNKLQNSITTHPSLIRVIIDYVIIALKGKGEIIIGDAPLQRCDFNLLIKQTGLKKILEFYSHNDINIKLYDFRKDTLLCKIDKFTHHRKYLKIIKLNGDPKGYKIINLSNNSNLHELCLNEGYKKFRVTSYDHDLMKNNHNLKDHKYLISNSVLQSDVVISVPKIKTHKKAGITGCLKNIIGINGHKDWLPHHRKGSCYYGGDEYLEPNIMKKIYVELKELDEVLFIRNPKLQQIIHYPIILFKALLYKALKILNTEMLFEGNWYGNDTIWRTIADLNQILIYTNKKGKVTNKKQRKILYFCDGIISGQKEGPLKPNPVKTGIIFGGLDPLMIDIAIVEIINFDFKKIKQLYKILNLKNRRISNFKSEDLMILSNNSKWNNKKLNELLEYFRFIPSIGWKNYIEKK